MFLSRKDYLRNAYYEKEFCTYLFCHVGEGTPILCAR
jgi:hypothetical protein